MASDEHSGVPYCGGGSHSTANLVRLLREAEEGKGLEIDYSDALGEALGKNVAVRDRIPRAISQQQKGVKRSLALLGRVPSLSRKRCVMSTIHRGAPAAGTLTHNVYVRVPQLSSGFTRLRVAVRHFSNC